MEVRYRACARSLPIVDVLPVADEEKPGEGGAIPPKAGEEDREPALKGWKETDTLL